MIDPRRPIVVMYHYVWPHDAPVPGGIRPMRPAAFEAQLNAIAQRYDIVGPDAFLKRIGETSDRPPCLLTFDDGTRDHAEVVAPILVRRKLSGVFFIVSDAARGLLMPTTHLVHWLLGGDDEGLWSQLCNFFGEATLGEPAEAARIYHYESPTRGRIKYALNMALPPETARAFATFHFARSGLRELDIARRWFADESQLRAMHDAGLTLGIHGRTHESLQRLGVAIADEIDDCAAFLTGLVGTRPTWWACPFGGSGASAADHAAMQASLKRAGVVAAVSTVASTVPAECDRLAIPRIDCAHLTF